MVDGIEVVRKSAARAATNPALWPETLWRLGRLVGSDMTVIEHVDRRRGGVEIGFTDRPDLIADSREPYEQYYFAINPRWHVARRLPPDAIHHDGWVGDDRVLEKSEYYMDFLRPTGLKYFIGARVGEDCERLTVLSMQRAADRGRVGVEEQRAFAAVLPDVRNALAMYWRVAHGPQGAPLAAVLDVLADPVAVVCGDGHLVFANAAMRELLAASDLVTLENHRLAGTRPEIARALTQALRHVAGSDSRAGAAAIVGDSSRLIFRLAPLSGDEARSFSRVERLYCLLIDDPARPPWRDVADAMRLYGLTRREATVGGHLAAGETVDEIARRLGVSRNTVRTHVAILRDKLGVRTSLAVAAEMRRGLSRFL
jgi:DNA-binding CsgD family transcriptional regulator/PAS domain-containing protein